ADPHAGADDRAAAEPDVVADDDWLRGLPPVQARAGLEGVGRREQLHVRAELHVVADRHGGDVEADQPPVGEAAGADERLIPVVALERGPDVTALAERAE